MQSRITFLQSEINRIQGELNYQVTIPIRDKTVADTIKSLQETIQTLQKEKEWLETIRNNIPIRILRDDWSNNHDQIFITVTFDAMNFLTPFSENKTNVFEASSRIPHIIYIPQSGYSFSYQSFLYNYGISMSVYDAAATAQNIAKQITYGYIHYHSDFDMMFYGVQFANDILEYVHSDFMKNHFDITWNGLADTSRLTITPYHLNFLYRKITSMYEISMADAILFFENFFLIDDVVHHIINRSGGKYSAIAKRFLIHAVTNRMQSIEWNPFGIKNA